MRYGRLSPRGSPSTSRVTSARSAQKTQNPPISTHVGMPIDDPTHASRVFVCASRDAWDMEPAGEARRLSISIVLSQCHSGHPYPRSLTSHGRHRVSAPSPTALRDHSDDPMINSSGHGCLAGTVLLDQSSCLRNASTEVTITFREVKKPLDPQEHRAPSTEPSVQHGPSLFIGVSSTSPAVELRRAQPWLPCSRPPYRGR